RIKQLPKDPSLINEAEGKVVKVISQLLFSLPAGHDYRVIFMQRPLPEVMASQDEMLRRRGTYDAAVDNSAVVNAFRDHLYKIHSWLSSQPHIAVLRLPYHDVLNQPRESSEKIKDFLGVELHLEAMTRQVDQDLYRQRKK
ncbi:MAG TPA: sulfotransferase domain-containing protein, partial [Candidatus Acidoferrum sp.]|nr:sulfotransferase domain-containing protein [Candidatus Acidoferrum sp.]